jgi:hypothetical protein
MQTLSRIDAAGTTGETKRIFGDLDTQTRKEGNSVRLFLPSAAVAVIAAVILLLAGGTGSKALGAANQAFGFNAFRISGFPGGRAAEMTGGGVYNLERNFVHSGGGFRCLSDITAGPFSGCLTGQGVRWDTAALLPSTPFQCTGSDAVKTAQTGDRTVVLLADFYRQGDGNIESFTAKMIVSDTDLDPIAEGVQNVWIQGIGCSSSAIANFN